MTLSDGEESQSLIIDKTRTQYGTVQQSQDGGHDFRGQNKDLYSQVQQIQDKELNIKVYKRRWYILFVYGMMAMTQCAVWNTFSPISAVGERVFGWDTAGLSLLTNWGPISYLLGTFAFSWILDVKGLRPACVLSAFLVAAGTGLRCITSKSSVATPLIHFGQFLNGLAGPIAMGAPPSLSAEWFPPEQRTTATAIATVTNTLGLAVSFLLGPYLVPEQKFHQNRTEALNSSLQLLDSYGVLLSASNVSNSSSPEYDVPAERDSVMRYMYYSFGFSGFCFLLFFTYFPSKPPLPPSPTASLVRLDFKLGILKLLGNRTFWLICFIYGLSMGILGCFNGVLDVNLKDHNISQTEAAWLGFYGVVGTCVACIVVARGADIFAKHMKWILIALYIVGGGCFLLFTLALISVVPDTDAVIYSTYIIANVFLGGASPLFFEMACEVTYPVAEGVTNLVLTLVNNIAGLLFLCVQLLPIGTMWENWCLVGSVFLCLPVLLLLKERYNRLDIDIVVEEKHSNDEDGE
ncbi:solute carrier family 49 member 4 homolog [Ruditapes philippinarum]|uniref:solute carrier family 49 member 4 homolog n=1 Tax=Ruditapes philippinarum TaxID=129788 RepID=UPI00295B7FC5|nr:solute carrier family 49 member 4 homolog [Ruditapes philippinarum]XP_060584065.1 solute carrier family 49 member 4 homolog [Ruditapes philippinarum]